MKEKIKIPFIVSIVLYLIVSYVKWDIIWILEIPKYDWNDRFGMLLAYLIVQALVQLVINDKSNK